MVEATTGLRVNWGKTTLSPVGIVPEMEDMADILGCDVIPLPISYFGLPLGARFSSSSI